MTDLAKSTRIVLVGNPNCGKTTLFNRLTGACQRVGNWSGVTVERASGYLLGDAERELIDLPGIYSLTLVGEVGEDERITRDYLRQGQYDWVLNVVDVAHLERQLYLTLQLLEMGIPVILVLSRCDQISREKLDSILGALRSHLPCPVFAIAATRGDGLVDLVRFLKDFSFNVSNTFSFTYPPAVEQALSQIALKVGLKRYHALSALEGEQTSAEPEIKTLREEILQETGSEPDILISTERYRLMSSISAIATDDFELESKSKLNLKRLRLRLRLDDILLDRFWGLPIFLGVMYLVFGFAIHFGGLLQEHLETLTQAYLVDGPAALLTQLGVPKFGVVVLALGLGKGIATTLGFVPVIGAMFLALTFLEDSGFMARAAFVMDRIMRALGLPGKAFLPMIVGFGCNVPAILGVRYLESRRDRILTVMMCPFMSCGARLAIFTVFVSTFFKTGGQNWVFALYLIGVIVAILTGLLLKRTLLKGPSVPLILEMPSYQWPHAGHVLRQAWHRVKKFVVGSGKLIITVCVLMAALNSIHLKGSQHSVLAAFGQQIVPLFEPMGIEQENWPAAVGLLSGVLAKEAVIGTLNTLYEQQADADLDSNLVFEGDSTSFSVASTAMLQKHFKGPSSVFAYLLFVLLYFPCVSSISAMVREVSWRWACFSVVWTTVLAYWVASFFYQCVNLPRGIWFLGAWFFAGLFFSFGLYFTLMILGKRLYRCRELPTLITLKT